MTIEEFIEARIADWEKAAKAAEPHWGADVERNPEIYGVLGDSAADHVMWHDPAAVLRQCAVWRKLLGDIADDATGYDMQVDGEFGVALRDYSSDPLIGDVMRRTAASIWSDHPEYQQEWAT